jgi:hypothetical protein
MAQGFTLPLTEISNKNLYGFKGRPMRNADNLTVIFETIV